MADMPAIEPMHQFLVEKLVQGPVFNVGGVTFDMSITNSVLSMLAGALILVAFFMLTARREIVPNRGQAMAESLYNVVDRVLVGPIIGDEKEGWSTLVRLIGSKSDYMAMHFRPTLDAIGVAQERLSALPWTTRLRLDYSFLSVTEAGLYHLTAQLAREAAARGGHVGDETYQRELAARATAERDSRSESSSTYSVEPRRPHSSASQVAKTIVRFGRQPLFISSAIERAASSTLTVPLTLSAAPGPQPSRCPPTITNSSGNSLPRTNPNVSKIGFIGFVARSSFTARRAFTGPGPT